MNVNLQAAVIGISTVLIILCLILFYFIQRQKSQNEIRKALIERFGSAQDLGTFLQSEGGQHFLTGLSAALGGPIGSIMSAIQKGIILVMLCLGCLLAASALSVMPLAALGMVLGAVGVGFLISAAVTHRMAAKWGLIDRPAQSGK